MTRPLRGGFWLPASEEATLPEAAPGVCTPGWSFPLQAGAGLCDQRHRSGGESEAGRLKASALSHGSHLWKGLQGAPWRPPHHQEQGGSEVIVSPVTSQALPWGAASPAPGELSDDTVLLTA